jgi:hypothetical protein
MNDVSLGISFIFYVQVICTIVIVYFTKSKVRAVITKMDYLDHKLIDLMAKLEQMDQRSNPR